MRRFDRDPVYTAHDLLGQRLVRSVDGVRLAGTIIEVEAYLGAVDRAAHTFDGRRTPRNESMYLPGGHAYVYFTYGMHHCLNVVCGRRDEGVAVLIRALEPTEGLDAMFRRRPRARRKRDLCSGPGKLAQALAIDRRLDGADLRRDPRLGVERVRRRALREDEVIATPRIGVGYAGAWAREPLRFLLRSRAPAETAGKGGAKRGRAGRTRSGSDVSSRECLSPRRDPYVPQKVWRTTSCGSGGRW